MRIEHISLFVARSPRIEVTFDRTESLCLCSSFSSTSPFTQSSTQDSNISNSPVWIGTLHPSIGCSPSSKIHVSYKESEMNLLLRAIALSALSDCCCNAEFFPAVLAILTSVLGLEASAASCLFFWACSTVAAPELETQRLWSKFIASSALCNDASSTPSPSDMRGFSNSKKCPRSSHTQSKSPFATPPVCSWNPSHLSASTLSSRVVEDITKTSNALSAVTLSMLYLNSRE
mmetsp:Transcript_26447/g.66284  ORF Transcript_26447/g.66284 Transcript_26447/m.66284 type:complete len:232 (-) Transcript_26447:617-1312(-)